MLRDIRMAARTLRSWRFGAAVAVATLAIGIGSATTLYAILRVALRSSVPDIEDIARVGRIYAASPSLGIDRTLVTLDDFEQALSGTHSFEAIAAHTGADTTMGSGSDADTWSVTRVSPDFFRVLGAHAAEGRLFTASDFTGSGSVALISETTWRRQFSGRSITDNLSVWLDGTERRVVGVVPAAFEFPVIGIAGDAWIPLVDDARDVQARVAVIARLTPESTWAMASAELATLAPPLQRDSSWRWQAIPVQQDARTRVVGATAGTLAPALIVLIIGCVNVSCMLLARGVRRDTELSIRAALGASRGAIVRQLLAEHTLLAAMGGLGGAAVARWAIRSIGAVLLPVNPSLAGQLATDPRLLPVALGSATLACLLFGTLPAIHLSRRDIASSLKGVGSPGRASVAGYSARDLIVFFELALAVVLVAATAMWFSFFTVLQQRTASFPADQVVVDRIAARDLIAIADRVRAIPGVEDITIASDLPGRIGAPRMLRAAGGRVTKGALVGVGESFFTTLGLSIVRGRAFDRTEAGAGATVVVVSESVAAALWPGEEALGRELYVDNQAATPLRVIGVSRNAIEFGGLGILTAGDVYHPIDATAAGEATLLVRARNARMAVRSIAEATRPSPSASLPKPAIFTEAIDVLPPERMSVVHMAVGFGLVALLLAASGIFGVVSESVAQRTTEFGVRMALGATTGRILRMVLTREVKLISAAMAVGAIGTVAVTRLLFADLVIIAAVHPRWPVTLMLACGVVAAVASALATYRIVLLAPWDVLRRT